mmetsp:Transcript_14334/g.46778  ORF Transcript_14334/g.46778 Transcript_14334/m.46778 type:complete len:322 (+) Transcript_14334:135-1100(+)|eukprot:CAMPEP_0118901962 /NCGR_PEP_ID=MMETSP1166-20130328/7458_1 /TAXON_ID=1104430 /ORGANISM="Chrysoreinhardia sp, Strain CCMP3193" /LENGTH=321 /DNA_ID=CAMNT_0006841155 /DNA_START=54 /DNA_END=1019 /DNA_ORIENTATION=-
MNTPGFGWAQQPRKNALDAKGLCDVAELPSWYEAYRHVRSGYRVGYTSCDCVRSVGEWHNETCNVWSHVGGCAIFGLRSLSNPGSTVEDLAVLAFTASATAMFGLSAGYHVFHPVSPTAFQRWLRADKFGIAVMIGGSFAPGVWLGFACEPLQVRVFWLLDALLLSCIGSSLAVGSTKNTQRHRAIFASLVLSALAPTLHWFRVAPAPLRRGLAPGLLAMFAWYALGFALYASAWPEKRYPGKFDLLGASHQLWHLCILAAAITWLRNVDTCLALLDRTNPDPLASWLASDLLFHRPRRALAAADLGHHLENDICATTYSF